MITKNGMQTGTSFSFLVIILFYIYNNYLLCVRMLYDKYYLLTNVLKRYTIRETIMICSLIDYYRRFRLLRDEDTLRRL